MQGAFKFRNDPRAMLEAVATSAEVAGKNLITGGSLTNATGTGIDIYPALAVPSAFIRGGEGLTIQTGASTITQLTTNNDLYFQKLWLYPGKAIAGGKLTLNVSPIYVGKSGPTPDVNGNAVTQVTTDLINPSDPPLLITLPLGQKMKLSQIIFQGVGATDGVYWSFT